jgi:hypothetical protein
MGEWGYSYTILNLGYRWIKMAGSVEVVHELSPEINVPPDKLNIIKNCNLCPKLGKEMEILRQELSSVNEVIKLLKEDMDLISDTLT